MFVGGCVSRVCAAVEPHGEHTLSDMGAKPHRSMSLTDMGKYLLKKKNTDPLFALRLQKYATSLSKVIM